MNTLAGSVTESRLCSNSKLADQIQTLRGGQILRVRDVRRELRQRRIHPGSAAGGGKRERSCCLRCPRSLARPPPPAPLLLPLLPRQLPAVSQQTIPTNLQSSQDLWTASTTTVSGSGNISGSGHHLHVSPQRPVLHGNSSSGPQTEDFLLLILQLRLWNISTRTNHRRMDGFTSNSTIMDGISQVVSAP